MWYIHPAGYSALKRKDILTFATTWMNLEDIIRLSMTNLDPVLKSRDITLPTKVRLVKAVVFLVVIYGCASWTIKKSECQRSDVFELWC